MSCSRVLAGTEKGNAGFGITVAMLDDGYRMIRDILHCLRFEGTPEPMRLETGQGPELSFAARTRAGTRCDLGARCYGLVRRYAPLLVTTVVGSEWPSTTLVDAKQITCAGLGDHSDGSKLLGVPHGADACYTNHARADQNDCEKSRGAARSRGMQTTSMAVPMGDDVMLSCQLPVLPRRR